jgi:hypothetical protein
MKTFALRDTGGVTNRQIPELVAHLQPFTNSRSSCFGLWLPWYTWLTIKQNRDNSGAMYRSMALSMVAHQRRRAASGEILPMDPTREYLPTVAGNAGPVIVHIPDPSSTAGFKLSKSVSALECYAVFSYGPDYPLAVYYPSLEQWFTHNNRFSPTTSRHHSLVNQGMAQHIKLMDRVLPHRPLPEPLVLSSVTQLARAANAGYTSMITDRLGVPQT